MVIRRVGDEYGDGDFNLLTIHLNLLDVELSRIDAGVQKSADPESDGLCDAGEYFIGHGFVAIQRYLTSTYAALDIAQSDALKEPPIVNAILTFAAAINAGANYWKHVEEWICRLKQDEKISVRSDALNTLKTLELATPWEEYTCANLLAILGCGRELVLSPLLLPIAEWRNNLLNRTKKI